MWLAPGGIVPIGWNEKTANSFLIVGDFDAEFLFKGHNQLNGVQAVSALIVDKVGSQLDLILVGTQVLGGDFFIRSKTSLIVCPSL